MTPGKEHVEKTSFDFYNTLRPLCIFIMYFSLSAWELTVTTTCGQKIESNPCYLKLLGGEPLELICCDAVPGIAIDTSAGLCFVHGAYTLLSRTKGEVVRPRQYGSSCSTEVVKRWQSRDIIFCRLEESKGLEATSRSQLQAASCSANQISDLGLSAISCRSCKTTKKLLISLWTFLLL